MPQRPSTSPRQENPNKDPIRKNTASAVMCESAFATPLQSLVADSSLLLHGVPSSSARRRSPDSSFEACGSDLLNNIMFWVARMEKELKCLSWGKETASTGVTPSNSPGFAALSASDRNFDCQCCPGSLFKLCQQPNVITPIYALHVSRISQNHEH